jgi:hypothetical protein
MNTLLLWSSSCCIAAGLVACASSSSGGGSDENTADGGTGKADAPSPTTEGGTSSASSGGGAASSSGGSSGSTSGGGTGSTSSSGGGPLGGMDSGPAESEGGDSGDVGSAMDAGDSGDSHDSGDSGHVGHDAGTGGTPTGTGVCDIFASGTTPCVAAHSTVRALFGAYDGSLYQVTRASDQTTKDVGVLSAGGFADSATQDAFCAGTTCLISLIYDQSGKNNNLARAPAGQRKETPDNEADATALKFTISGHTVYGVHLPVGTGYRIDRTTGVAVGDDPETEYMVTSGTFFNGSCCFDYGNAETNNTDDGAGTMEAVYFGNWTAQGKGAGDGPWVMADMENGVYAGPSFAANPMDTPLTSTYVTAMVIGRSGTFALKGGNAQMGALTTVYDGARPKGYNPMKKQGAIILGIGGDNTSTAQGDFFEGVLTSGAASDVTASAVQANIVAAGYGM